MASPAFESPVVRHDDDAAVGPIVLSDESRLSKVGVRAADGTPAARDLGLTLGVAVRRDDVLVARIRPDEWLVVGDADSVAALIRTLDVSGHVSTVDITHSRLLFRLTGPLAARAMEKICSLDFSDSMTPDGACTGASVAKVGCDIIRADIEGGVSYLILADRSYGQYLFDSLIDAKAEFT